MSTEDERRYQMTLWRENIHQTLRTIAAVLLAQTLLLGIIAYAVVNR